MSEALREQRPLLLREDLSEEEQFPELPRRYQPIYRGRAKSTAKGATAIITRWPEHWSSTFTFCWMCISIMGLTIFAIYNVVIAFVLLPSVDMKPTNSRAPNHTDFDGPSHLPEIFMHFFVNTDDEADLNKHLPYIEIVSDKHLDYNFNLILLHNDTAHEPIKHSSEENNEIALNSLWFKTQIGNRKLKSRENIKIRDMVLSQYMDESPLRTGWRHVPSHFLSFLVKAISIWEKGGIAINPEILMPQSSYGMYVEKFEHILRKFKKTKLNEPNESQLNKYENKRKDKFKKKVNNIRDIINILEREDNNTDSQNDLTEAENIISPAVSKIKRNSLSTSLQAPKNKSKSSSPIIIELPKIPLISSINDTEILDNKQHYHVNTFNDNRDALVVNEGFEILDENNESKLSLLPMFLEFLFHEKPKVKVPEYKKEADNLVRHRKNAIHKDKIKNNTSKPIPNSINRTEIKADEKYKPMIISTKGIAYDRPLKINEPKTTETLHEDSDELAIDLRGNMLATKTSCHAFIGTVLSNVVHHPPEETLQDFIIAELSLFCKGLLSSCRGIDVILV